MPFVKYIADGFPSDSKKLLDEFAAKNSMEFTTFADVWKKHHFSLIYMGRPTKKELKEFTNEIFKLTGKYLTSKFCIYKVGGIYMWYGLYLNQIIDPPVRIRITHSQAEIVLNISEFAESNKEQSLVYVISYLFDNAFEFVVFPNLMGPLMCKDREQAQEQYHQKEFELDNGLREIKQSRILDEVYDIAKEYSKLCKSQFPVDEYKSYLDELNHLLSDEVGSHTEEFAKADLSEPNCSKVSSPKPDIGSRRAQLKSAQFSKSIFPKQDSDGKDSNLDDNFETRDCFGSPLPKADKTKKSRRRITKQKKKLECPKKNIAEKEFSSDSDSFDIVFGNQSSDLLSASNKIPYEKARRIRRYYEEDPTERKEFQNLQN